MFQEPYDSYVVLTAVHQNLKSPAADLVVKTGPEVSVEQILHKFRKRYGCVLSVEVLSEKLYSLKHDLENVAACAFPLERWCIRWSRSVFHMLKYYRK